VQAGRSGTFMTDIIVVITVDIANL
jgi:hypothetical protein